MKATLGADVIFDPTIICCFRTDTQVLTITNVSAEGGGSVCKETDPRTWNRASYYLFYYYYFIRIGLLPGAPRAPYIGGSYTHL